jgi:ribosome-associated protein
VAVHTHQKDTSQSDTELESLPSKTRVKQAMHALQELGEQLAKLDPAKISELDLPENLTEALLAARKMTKHGARRRQMQLIGKLMRSVDPGPVQQKLDTWQSSGLRHAAWLHQLERWRDRLLSDEAAVTEFAQTYPQADIQHLRGLLRNIQKEKLANKPPKSFRILFQELRKIIPEPSI